MSEQSRTRLAAVALVNWKGVFFQEYELDRTVTALEGVNAAGKTTVMVAVFTALFPDQRWLDFVNVTVLSRTTQDRGIYGRLGRPGPSWSVLDVRSGSGERWLVGVHLQRGVDRNVDLQPFIVSGVPSEDSLSDLLLMSDENEQAQVPDPSELDTHLGRRGLGLQFLDPQAYFEELFQVGVLAAPLRSQAERGRYFEVLQTSLMGGLSDKVRLGLRDYLLREDSSVAVAVKRMQDNLAECRKTRQRLSHFDKVHRAVGTVHDTGLRMFAFGIHATRRRAEELEQKAQDSREKLDTLKLVSEASRTAKEAAGAAREMSKNARELARIEHSRRSEVARRVDEAHRLATEHEKLHQEFAAVRNELSQAEANAAVRKDLFEQAKNAEQRAREALGNIAGRKAAQATAWEEVSRKVGRYRQASRVLIDAAHSHPGLLPKDPQKAKEVLPALLERTQDELADVRRSIRSLQKELNENSERNIEFNRARSHLEGLVGGCVPPEQAYSFARAELLRLDSWQGEIIALPELQRETRRVGEQANRQRQVWAKAQAISHPSGVLATSFSVRNALSADNDELLALSERRKELQTAYENASTLVHAGEFRLPSLESDARRWRDSRDSAAALEIEATSRGVHAALQVIDRVRDEQAERLRQLHSDRTSLEQQRLALGAAGRVRDPRLDEVATKIGGRSVLELLEDTPLGTAALVEARLGPLLDGVVVDDVLEAANAVADMEDAPRQVVLVSRLQVPQSTEVTRYSVIVEEASGLRVTRLPPQPIVGEAAREAYAETLSERIRELDHLEEGHLTLQVELQARRERVVQLAAQADWLDREDPHPAAERARDALQRARRDLSAAALALSDLSQTSERLRCRAEALSALVPDCYLLDEPDLNERFVQNNADILRLQAMEEHLRGVEGDRGRLRESVDSLKSLPLSEDGLERLSANILLATGRESVLDTLEAALLVIDPEALGWSDQEEVLAGKQVLLTSLDAEEQTAKIAHAEASTALEGALLRHQQTFEAEANSRARRDSINLSLQEKTRQLKETNVVDASADALSDAQEQVSRAKAAEEAADSAYTSAVALASTLESQYLSASTAETGAATEAEQAMADASPWGLRWRDLEEHVFAAELLPAITTLSMKKEVDQDSGVNLSRRATDVRKQLRQALTDAGDDEELQKRLDDAAAAEDGSGRRYLEDWQAVRRWVLNRVPREVSESHEPSMALARLAESITALRKTLERDEKRLRTDAGEIARSIHARYDREHRRMKRLSRSLGEAGFGSIHGIRVHLGWHEHMRRVLDALQDQGDLFRNADMRLEDALAELYRAQVGGRIQGQRLLDYREYLDIDLQIRRLGKTAWISTRQEGISTGEAIGVGASVLMLVLAAWEDDYQHTRSRPGIQPLRFLFLDEAARLSPDSLTVLFELSRRMNLQVLVAAPTVARLPGAVVYRLARGLDDAGEEHVVATGRRIVEKT